MSTSFSATLPADLKTPNQDRAAASGRVAASSANNNRKPKRLGRRGVILLALGALILAAATYWYISNAGYEATDDAAVEAHVIQSAQRFRRMSKPSILTTTIK